MRALSCNFGLQHGLSSSILLRVDIQAFRVANGMEILQTAKGNSNLDAPFVLSLLFSLFVYRLIYPSVSLSLSFSLSRVLVLTLYSFALSYLFPSSSLPLSLSSSINPFPPLPSSPIYTRCIHKGTKTSGGRLLSPATSWAQHHSNNSHCSFGIAILPHSIISRKFCRQPTS